MKLWSRTKKHKNIVDLRCRLFFALSMAWQTHARTEIWLCICPFFMIVSHCIWMSSFNRWVALILLPKWEKNNVDNRQCNMHRELNLRDKHNNNKNHNQKYYYFVEHYAHTYAFCSEGMPLFWLVFVVNNSSFLMFRFCSSKFDFIKQKKTCCTPAYCRLSFGLFFQNSNTLIYFYISLVRFCVCRWSPGRYVSWQFFSHLFCKLDKLIQCKWGAYDVCIYHSRVRFHANFGTIFFSGSMILPFVYVFVCPNIFPFILRTKIH